MNKGLTYKEVKFRQQQGYINNKQVNYSRSLKQICLTNILTLFNFINIALFILVLTTGSFQNSLFIFVILINTIIAIIQEIRAKKIIDKLTIINQEKVKVYRDNEEKIINQNEIVIDDILLLSSGDAVVVDSLVIESNSCEVDESIITGESNSILKNKNDNLLSGSIILSGNCLARVVSVGEDNYTSKLVKDASKQIEDSSYLKDYLNRILKFVTFLIIPTAILLFVTQYFFSGQGYNEAILSTVAGVIGMIPEGLILLTSLALTVGVIKMAKKKVIIQKLNGIETLSCVDILCLDKTGTITDGDMEVVDYINVSKENIENIIANMVNNDLVNATDKAIHRFFKVKEILNIKDKIPFSSVRKYSLVQFEKGTYALGAIEYMTNEKVEDYNNYLDTYIKRGYRIITLVKSSDSLSKKLSNNTKVLGFIIIKDSIRENARETLEYFKKQDVKIKIISGDNPKTVSNIMKQLKFKGHNKYISGEDLPEDINKLRELALRYDIFGRVTPYQKRLIIKALKENNTVGMIGDGVNDILALKEANCGIALSSGVQAVRSVSEVVLTESDFSVLPDIVNEGRRVVNNIERVASLYLVKTIYSFILSLMSIVLTHQYPFYPIQLSLISAICVGVPSFILALEPNYTKVKRGFIIKVFRNALPSGITVSLNIILIIFISHFLKLDFDKWRIIIVSLTGFINLRLLYNISNPLTFIRFMLIWGCFLVFYELLLIFPQLFLVNGYNFKNILIIILFGYINVYIVKYLETIYDKLKNRFYKKAI